MPSLILASASPQRMSLLLGLGATFTVQHSSVDEDAFIEPDPVKRSITLANLKAGDVHGKNKDAVVIGCDTLVVASTGALLEKPKDAKDAERMLRLQSGKTSVVHSAVCVIGANGKMYEGISSSNVRFKKLSDEDVAWWIGTGLWKDRSGAFQIDGPGQLMIEHIEGDWTGIVGLPVFLVGELLKKAGYLVQS